MNAIRSILPRPWGEYPMGAHERRSSVEARLPGGRDGAVNQRAAHEPVISPIESTESARLVVVSNWPALLEK